MIPYDFGFFIGFAPAVEVERKGFRTHWDMTGQKLQGLELQLKAFMLTFEIYTAIDQFFPRPGNGSTPYLLLENFGNI